MASTATSLLKVAAAEIGYREGRDANGNWNNLTKYGIWYAEQVHNSAFRAVAWCDMFVSWCAAQSGNGDIIPLSAWVPGRLSYYRSRNQTGMFPPRPGDIGILLSNGTPVHVFLVEAWLGDLGYVQTIEGNTNDSGSPQGNGVYRLKRRDWATNPNIIYCRPSYGVSTPAPTPAPTTQEDELMSLNVTNPATNESWPIDKALWSMWYYILEERGAKAAAVQNAASIAALTETVKQLASTPDQPVDMEAVKAAARDGASAALATLDATVTLQPAPPAA